MDINDILENRFFKELVNTVVTDDYEIVTRPNAFVFCKAEEGGRDVHRIIVLPPCGYTANEAGQMNSHDEAEYAKIEVKGLVRPDKDGFSKTKNCLQIISAFEDGSVSDLAQPYITYNDNQVEDHIERKTVSAGESPIAVVKSNGYGFYHNLVNTTDEWLVLQLHKKLRPQKTVDLAPFLKDLEPHEVNTLTEFFQNIKTIGDEIFDKRPDLIDAISSLNPQRILPALSNMLHVHDSGKHEACTVFAVMLRMGKRFPDLVQDFLRQAVEQENIPSYYAEQLSHKIHNYTADLNTVQPQIGLEM